MRDGGKSLPGGSERARERAAKLKEWPQHSRVRVLCLSANAFGSDWA